VSKKLVGGFEEKSDILSTLFCNADVSNFFVICDFEIQICKQLWEINKNKGYQTVGHTKITAKDAFKQVLM